MKKKNETIEHLLYDKTTKIMCVSIWIIYIIILLSLSLLPREIISSTGTGLLGKVLHFCFYTGLFILTLVCFIVLELKIPITLTIFFGMCLAIGTEILQLFIPGRNGTWSDTCINLSGLFIIPIIMIILYERSNEYKEIL